MKTNTFDEKLDTILENLIVREFEEVLLVDDEDIHEAKEAIKALVLEEFIGEDEGSFEKKNNVVIGGSYTDSQGERNHLRAQQRSIITKGE